MNCRWCKDGYYPAVSVNGVVIHRTPATVVVARFEGEKIVPLAESIYRDGIVPCLDAQAK